MSNAWANEEGGDAQPGRSPKSAEVHPVVPMEIAGGKQGKSTRAVGGGAEGKQPGCYARCCANSSRKMKVFKFLNSAAMTTVVTAATFLALYMDDLRLAFTDASADTAFGITTIFIFLLFFSEFILSVYSNPKYAFSFFFWLDLIAALSLIPDIPWIWDAIMGNSSSGGFSLAQARAARASRVGTKAGRIVRFVRLIRVVRVGKLVEMCGKRSKKNKAKAKEYAESNLSKSLSEQTTRKVTMMVLAMLLVVPMLAYVETDETETNAINQIVLLADDSTVTPTAFNEAVAWLTKFYKETRPVLSLQIYGTTHEYDFVADDITTFRNTEVRTGESTGDSGDTSILVVSDKTDQVEGAEYNLILTTLVLVLLTLGSFVFSNATTKMVVTPIERMMDRIHELKKNPLLNILDDKQGAEGDINKENEAGTLERTLHQLTSLLQIGFGEAGSALISKSMNTDNADHNPLVDGTRMIGLFGFCDIRRFTDATECLREEVMLYVNRIAQIVHNEVIVGGGNPNKNIGDAFLVVWRAPKELDDNGLRTIAQTSKAGRNLDPGLFAEATMRRINALADNALAAFIRCITEIQQSETLRAYSKHPEIVKGLGPNFTVALGFGLHVGWAIEGPIGSKFKIDCSYLSPNVNMAETLESSTKMYGIPLLMSGEFWALLSPATRNACRHIDRVVTAGRMKIPMDLYTFDVDSMNVENIITSNKGKNVDNLLEQYRQAPAKNFTAHFADGVRAYIKGDWKKAKEQLETVKKLRVTDGPTNSLLTFMAESNYIAPQDWEGHREI